MDFDDITFHKNQLIDLSHYKEYLRLVSLQNKSTPGICFYADLKCGSTYRFHIKYFVKTGKKIVKFWFTFKNNTLIDAFNHKSTPTNDFDKIFISHLDTRIKIGILFINPNLNDTILIRNISFQKIVSADICNAVIIDQNMYFKRFKNSPKRPIFELGEYENIDNSPIYYSNMIFDSRCHNIIRAIDSLHLSHDIHILDLGCSIGRTLENLRSHGFHHLHGIDKHPEAAKYMKFIYPDLHKLATFTCGDINHVLRKDNTIYDVVFTISSLTHLNLAESFELFNWLQSHCKFFIALEPDKDKLDSSSIYVNTINVNSMLKRHHFDTIYNGIPYIKTDIPSFYILTVMENIAIHKSSRLQKISIVKYLPDSFFKLPNLITITWKKNISLPFGIEETFFHCLDNKLVFSCGLTGGPKFSYGGDNNDRKVKLGKYDRGFKNISYFFDLNSQTNSWKSIDNFPSIERQAGRTVVINNKMFCFGGYKFTPCKTHNPKVVFKKKKSAFQTFDDGFMLEYRPKFDQWSWSKLPDLPLSVSGFGMTVINNYIYICCGAHRKPFFECSQLMVKFKDEHNHDIEVGRILYRLDINKISKGWEQYDTFPGTLRFNPAMTSIKSYIYIIGGIHPNHDWVISRNISDRFYNVMDNWKYHINTKKWFRIDTDIANNYSNWGPSNDSFVYKNRYLVLIGGYAYGKLIINDTFYDNPCHDGTFSNNIFIYDTILNKCHRSSNMFCCINVPDYLIIGNHIYLIGGESTKYKFDGEYFGRHSDVFAIGTISEKLLK